MNDRNRKEMVLVLLLATACGGKAVDLGQGGGSGSAEGLDEPETVFETTSQRVYGIAADDTRLFTLLGTNDSMDLVSCAASGCGGSRKALYRGDATDAVRLSLTPLVNVGGWLFWMFGNGNSGGIASCPTAGCTSIAFVASWPDSGWLGGLAGDGQHVYWIDINRALLRLAPGETTPTVVRQLTDVPQTGRLLAVGEFVHFIALGGGMIYRVRKDGTAAAEKIAEGSNITGIDGQGDSLYYSRQLLSGNVVQCRLDAPCEERALISNQPWPSGVRVDGSQLFWANGSSVLAGDLGIEKPASLHSCDLPGCTEARERVRELQFPRLAPTADRGLQASTFAFSRDFVLWLDEPSPGTTRVQRLAR